MREIPLTTLRLVLRLTVDLGLIAYNVYTAKIAYVQHSPWLLLDLLLLTVWTICLVRDVHYWKTPLSLRGRQRV